MSDYTTESIRLDNDPNLWESVIVRTFQVTNLDESGTRYIAIPPQSPDTIINSPVLLANAIPDRFEARWRWGATLVQQIPHPINPGEWMDAGEVWIRPNQWKLCVFPEVVDNYRLQIRVPWWFREVSIAIWKYNGDTRVISELALAPLIQEIWYMTDLLLQRTESTDFGI